MTPRLEMFDGFGYTAEFRGFDRVCRGCAFDQMVFLFICMRYRDIGSDAPQPSSSLDWTKTNHEIPFEHVRFHRRLRTQTEAVGSQEVSHGADARAAARLQSYLYRLR